MKNSGNPFIQDGEELENINSKCIMSSASIASVRNALNIGLQAYDKFCEEACMRKTFDLQHNLAE